MKLVILEPEYSICRLPAGTPIPTWATTPFSSITITDDEVSIVTANNHLPVAIKREDGWRMLRIVGQLDFDQVGVIARISTLLAEADIPIFVVSTFDTDYLLLKSGQLVVAKMVLQSNGYEFV